MANTIEYQATMATALDKVLAAKSKTAKMENNATGVIYKGGNEFKMGKISFGTNEVSDYDRAKGYPAESVNLALETFKFKKDLGKKFTIDSMDVDESNYLMTMTTVMSEYVRTVEVPAIDKFRFSEIVKLAKQEDKGVKFGAHVESYKVAANGALSQLRKSMSEVMTGTGLENEDLDIYMSRTYYNALIGDKDVQKVVNIAGSPLNLNSTTKSVDGTSVTVVDDDIIGCLYIVISTKAPIAIVKHRVSNVFTPEQNPDADAYVGNERCYHTLEIADNQFKGVAVCEAASA